MRELTVKQKLALLHKAQARWDEQVRKKFRNGEITMEKALEQAIMNGPKWEDLFPDPQEADLKRIQRDVLKLSPKYQFHLYLWIQAELHRATEEEEY
jgi:hypothetical protein